ncbi:cupin domain-containing protein [Dermacoccaceae bacterium W4C1]
MRILELTDLPSTEVDRFGSVGFRVSGVVTLTRCRISVVRLHPGGHIGRHEAVGHQIFAPITGEARVRGDGDRSVTLTPGQAVWWTPGEAHDTTSATGATAVVIEGELQTP